MESDKAAKHQKLKERLSAIIGTGASTIVLATTILSALPADAKVDTNPAGTLQQRIEKVRPQAQDANANMQQQDGSKIQLAWWRNWRNGGWRGWGWPNWHNWRNWRNW